MTDAKSCWLYEDCVRHFLSVGRFTATEWLILSDTEKAFILGVSEDMKIEDALALSVAVHNPKIIADELKTDAEIADEAIDTVLDALAVGGAS